MGKMGVFTKSGMFLTGLVLMANITISQPKFYTKENLDRYKPKTEQTIHRLQYKQLDRENLKKALKGKKAIFFGEIHCHNSHRDIIADSLHLFIDAGVGAIGLEHLDTTYAKDVDKYVDGKITQRFSSLICHYSISNPTNKFSVWNLLQKANGDSLDIVCTGPTEDQKDTLDHLKRFNEFIDATSKTNAQLIKDHISKNPKKILLHLGGLAHANPVKRHLRDLGVECITIRHCTFSELENALYLSGTDDDLAGELNEETKMLVENKDELFNLAKKHPIMIKGITNDIIIYSNSENKAQDQYELEKEILEIVDEGRDRYKQLFK